MSFKIVATVMAGLMSLSQAQEATPDPIFGLEFGFCPVGDDLAIHDTMTSFDPIRMQGNWYVVYRDKYQIRHEEECLVYSFFYEPEPLKLRDMQLR